jgi:site-specific recombinase XerD
MEDPLLGGWALALRAKGCSSNTVDTYRYGIHSLIDFLDGKPLADAGRSDVRSWINSLQDRGKSSNTIRTYVKAAGLLFDWAVEEGDIIKSPVAGVVVPEVVPEVPCLDDDDIRRLLATAPGGSFTDRRDKALLMVLLDTGVRVGELCGMRESELDPLSGTFMVRGKGAKLRGPRLRTVAMGARCAQTLNRYMRVRRSQHDELWIGRRKNPLTTSGAYLVVRRRGAQAGIPDLHPHALRHTWASKNKLAGMSEGDLMVLGGWESRAMLDRYGKSAATQRALIAAKRFSLGDQI